MDQKDRRNPWNPVILMLLRHADESGRSRQLVASYHGARTRWTTWVEGGVLAAEVILLAFFAVPIWSSRVDALPAERERTVVRVIAEQFAWNMHYPGADGVFGRRHPSRQP